MENETVGFDMEWDDDEEARLNELKSELMWDMGNYEDALNSIEDDWCDLDEGDFHVGGLPDKWGYEVEGEVVVDQWFDKDLECWCKVARIERGELVRFYGFVNIGEPVMNVDEFRTEWKARIVSAYPHDFVVFDCVVWQVSGPGSLNVEQFDFDSEEKAQRWAMGLINGIKKIQ